MKQYRIEFKENRIIDRHVNSIQENDFTFNVNNESSGCIKINVSVGGISKLFIIDTESTCNIIDSNMRRFQTTRSQSYSIICEPFEVLGVFGEEFTIEQRCRHLDSGQDD